MITVLYVADSMKIYVAQWNGATELLKVQPSDTIKSVKLNVSEKLKIPEEEQVLQYGHKTLQDKHTLLEYGISEGELLHLGLKLPG